MKNKKALYYAILPIAYFILSLTCVSITFVVLKIILDIYYRYNSQYGGTLIDAIKFFMLFKAQSGLDRNLNYVIIAICTFIVYYLFMRKTYVGLAKIVNATNQMAAGDLDKVIEIDCKGDTKKLGDNINIISSLLKDVTIQERKAQQTKADLITNVSHDLRTPLTSIKGYLGLINGDKIVEVNGSKIHTSSDLSLEISEAKDSTMKIVYERNGEKNEVNVTPVYDKERETYRVGFTYTVIKNPTVLQCIKEGANETISLVSQTFKSIGMIFTGKANLKTDVGGPVTIVRMSSQAAKVGVMYLFMLVAILSVSVGIFNLLPFPALDGGWSVLLIIEFITKKKVPDKVVGALNTIGFMILIGIMVLVTIKDILYPINL